MKITEKLGDFGLWIMTDPKAMQVLLFLSAMGGSIFFGFLLTLSIIFQWNMIFQILYGIMFALSLHRVYKYWKAKKRGGKDFTDGYTAADFMDYDIVDDDYIEIKGDDNKNGRKQEKQGKQNKTIPKESSVQDDGNQLDEIDKEIREGILKSYQESKSTIISDTNKLSTSNKDS